MSSEAYDALALALQGTRPPHQTERGTRPTQQDIERGKQWFYDVKAVVRALHLRNPLGFDAERFVLFTGFTEEIGKAWGVE